jgi:hypothetical protein
MPYDPDEDPDDWGFDSDYDDDDDAYRRRSDVIHESDYTPKLNFRGKGPAFYGMELEVSTGAGDEDSVARAVYQVCGSDLVYVKYDGSVRGIEIVTHPCDYPFWRMDFPWRDLMDMLKERDCWADPEQNGIHVHVNRDGFTGPAHAYRWLKLIYRNEEDVVRIAGRYSAEWATFSQRQRKGQGAHLKNAKKLKNHGLRMGSMWNRWDAESRELLGAGNMHAAEPTGARYCAVNLTNPATYEVRAFASTLDFRKAQARLQLVAASVEYTRTLTTHDVIFTQAWEWAAFKKWVQESGEYPQLANWM